MQQKLTKIIILWMVSGGSVLPNAVTAEEALLMIPKKDFFQDPVDMTV